MTLLEATIKAWQQVGLSPEVIEWRIRVSNAAHPEAKRLMAAPVKEGSEQEFIEELVKIERKLLADPEMAAAAYRAGMEKINKINEQN